MASLAIVGASEHDSRLMRVLLVLDNVDDDRVLTEFLPSCGPVSVIITTRKPLVGQNRDSSAGGGLTLSGLLGAEAVNLLRARLPEGLWKSEPETTLTLLFKHWHVGRWRLCSWPAKYFGSRRGHPISGEL